MRSLIEIAFAILKNRFRRLKYVYHKDIATMTSTVITACIMHNRCIMSNDELDEILDGGDGKVPHMQPNLQNYNADSQEDGARKRLQIARNL
jgi:hypothetical protein